MGAGYTLEALESGHQPETLDEWIGQVVGAATMIDYGPSHPDVVFDETSASVLVKWATAGIRNLPGGADL